MAGPVAAGITSERAETTHAVELGRHQQTVGHGLAGLGDDAVLEALRQVEDAQRIAAQRAVGGHLVAVALRRLRPDRLGQAGEGQAGRTGRQETATGETHDHLEVAGRM